ncbi:MAG: hypothetical protein WD034_12000 [Parvibaculum sp.]|uniref:hypothetical protein n=1 Tax=Parvibaculum sp. TaxID=2024848 RepID=UPI0034A00D1F
MSRLTGPRILALAFGLLYAIFWFWYGGAGRPLSDAEIARYMARLDALAAGEQSPLGLRGPLEAWARADDGREFFMVNLIDDPADPAAANAYNRVILPELIKRGGVPVFISRPFARFIEPAGLEGWDQVAIVRYRSLRDLLDMITAPGSEDIKHLKEASVSKTHVFPTHAVFSFIWMRFIAAVLLAMFGIALHVVLRRFDWYVRA